MSSAAIKTVLFVCGSYNPPTNMHLRMFELARDHLFKLGHTVCGGIMSPVHDKYGKKDLVSSKHRCEMVRLALEDSTWIKLSEWEAQQSEWTRTRVSLDHHEDELNQQLDAQCTNKTDVKRARHDQHNGSPRRKIQVMFLCGVDVLESMAVPNLWSADDINHIAGHHGIVVITRGDTNPAKFIYQHDILSKHMNKIIIVNEWIKNEISSTYLRRALRRGDSIKYLINDKVEQYIYQHGLYSVVESPHLEVSPILDLLSNLNNNFLPNGSPETHVNAPRDTCAQPASMHAHSKQQRALSRSNSSRGTLKSKSKKKARARI